MSYKGYAAAVEFDPEDELFVGHLDGIGDIVGFHAETVSGLKAAFHAAVDDYVATCNATGKQPEKPRAGKVTLRLPPDLHGKAARAAALAGKSLDQWAEDMLREGAVRALLPV